MPRAYFIHALVGLCVLTLAPFAAGHPEGFSGLRVQIEPQRVQLIFTIHTRDMGQWFPPPRFTDYVADVCRAIEASPADLVEVQIDEQPAAQQSIRAFLLEPGLIEIDVTYAADGARTLQIWSRHLVYLPRGHQQLLWVEDMRGPAPRMLHEGTLSLEEDAIVIDLPPMMVAGASENGQAAIVTGGGQLSFFTLGVEHIITGYDHLLFLAALLLVCRNFREAAGIITCFTVAHSITLALAALDVVHLSPRLVEPLIAASIVYVAIENLAGKHRMQWRAGVTFAFGLLHGLGFAGVLREIGLGSTTRGIAIPLLNFNLGVEAGQLAIAALLLPVLFALKRRDIFDQRAVPACSVIVGVLGAYWMVTRVLEG
jgi:hydrogenase/urease accessory protein HupE